MFTAAPMGIEQQQIEQLLTGVNRAAALWMEQYQCETSSYIVK